MGPFLLLLHDYQLQQPAQPPATPPNTLKLAINIPNHLGKHHQQPPSFPFTSSPEFCYFYPCSFYHPPQHIEPPSPRDASGDTPTHHRRALLRRRPPFRHCPVLLCLLPCSYPAPRFLLEPSTWCRRKTPTTLATAALSPAADNHNPSLFSRS